MKTAKYGILIFTFLLCQQLVCSAEMNPDGEIGKYVLIPQIGGSEINGHIHGMNLYSSLLMPIAPSLSFKIGGSLVRDGRFNVLSRFFIGVNYFSEDINSTSNINPDGKIGSLVISQLFYTIDWRKNLEISLIYPVLKHFSLIARVSRITDSSFFDEVFMGNTLISGGIRWYSKKYDSFENDNPDGKIGSININPSIVFGISDKRVSFNQIPKMAINVDIQVPLTKQYTFVCEYKSMDYNNLSRDNPFIQIIKSELAILLKMYL